MELSVAQAAHMPQIAQLRKEHFERTGQYEAPLSPTAVWFVATSGETVLAAVAALQVPGESKLFLSDVYALRTKMGKKAVSMLIAEFNRSNFRSATVVPVDNEPMWKALQKRGWRITGYMLEN